MVVYLVHPSAWFFLVPQPQVGGQSHNYSWPPRDEACQAPTSDNVVMAHLSGGSLVERFASGMDGTVDAAIAAVAELVKAKSFTIGGEAVVLGPDGLSRFEELAARTAILPLMARICAISHSRTERPRFGAAAGARPGILLNEPHACQLGAEGVVSKRIDATYQSRPCREHRRAAGARRDWNR
jgi:hypothetical protein